ncbi:MAG: AsmA-like C-terminal region-containing protein [Kiritimatiellae bacterium]|nr:AsmA-like C-terminal region-containing protein [Kiritimatiellia bacterium]
MKTTLKILKWFAFFFVGLFGVALAMLLSFEVDVPQEVLSKICERLSSDSFLVCVDRATIRVPRRIRLERVRVLDRSLAEARPFASASRVILRFRYNRWPINWRNALSLVEIEDPFFPRLPASYYQPSTNAVARSGVPREPIRLSLPFALPALSPFRLRLVRPEILGISATSAVASEAICSPDLLAVRGVRVAWPDADARMSAEGDVTIDFAKQRLYGQVHGQARQRNIRPMLWDALDVKSAFPYYDGFTGVETPVDVSCPFVVDFAKEEFTIDVLLHPTGGRYNGVPVRKADGNVCVQVFGLGGEPFDVRVTVGPVEAALADGGRVAGTVSYENFGNVPAVHFDGVETTTTLSNALAVADVFTDGTLDCLQPEGVATIRLEGVLAVGDTPVSTNRVDGTIAFDRGAFFGIPLRSANVGFATRGTRTSFEGARASLPRGGKLTGGGWVDSPDGVVETARFGVSLRGDELAFSDVAEALGLSFGGNKGFVSGNLELTGGLGTNVFSSLCGRGDVKVSEGQLAQIKFFAGLTSLLAEKVPGISGLVNQSAGEVVFSLSNGVLRAEKLIVEGKVFSVRGVGMCDLATGGIDMLVRVQLFRNDSFLNTLATPITWPFSKLLLQFRVRGTLDEPTWRYAPVSEELNLNVFEKGAEIMQKLNPFAKDRDVRGNSIRKPE